jgi:DNA ligase-1
MGSARTSRGRRHLLALLGGAVALPFSQGAGATALPLLLAHEADDGIDPNGWLVSEKLDGVRAQWDGMRLRFRGGGVVAVPAWFTRQLPSLALDGELWMGRGRFDALSGLVRRASPDDAAWQQVRYMVFELPGGPRRFDERAAALTELAGRSASTAWQAVPQSIVTGRDALRRRLDEVVRGGGEGLMLHRADAAYVTGRSRVLLKLKPLHDADAVVVGHAPGRGRLTGRLGALQVRTDAGVVFQIGTGLSDDQRDSPPPLGSTVTYTYRGFTPQGVPRFASFLRVRPDA